MDGCILSISSTPASGLYAFSSTTFHSLDLLLSRVCTCRRWDAHLCFHGPPTIIKMKKGRGGGIRETHRSYMPPFDVASGSFRMALESTHHWQVPTCPFGSSPPPSPPRSFHNSRSLSPTEGITTVWMHTRRVLRHCTSPLVDATRVATVLRTNVAIERQTRHGQSIPNLSWKLEQRCRFESETRKKRRVLEDALRPHLNGGCA